MCESDRGYGSQWHLLRYLGYHRNRLNKAIEQAMQGKVIDWLDHRFDRTRSSQDLEWKGVDFVDNAAVRREWESFWPQTGNSQNWDAIARVQVGSEMDWVLVEAKAHLAELKTVCRAEEAGGLPVIQQAFEASKQAFGVTHDRDWLSPCYQYCNRLAVLHFLREHLKKAVPSRLLFLYFLGDNHPGQKCPKTEDEWNTSLKEMYDHVGLNGDSSLEKRIHNIFLPVCDLD